MASSILIYKGKGFWISDYFLGAIYCLLHEELNRKINNSNNFDKLKKDLEFGIAGYYDGAVDLNLDDYDDKTINLLKNLLLSIQENFQFTNNKELTNYLNNYRNKLWDVKEKYFNEDISTIKKLNKLMLDLLNGNLDCNGEKIGFFLEC